MKPKRLRTVGRGGWHSFSVYIFACFFNFGPKPIMPFLAEHFRVLSSWYLPNLLSMNESSVTKRCCYVSSRFLRWVYGNPLTFLVGIRRIPAYHVDYTTGLEWITVMFLSALILTAPITAVSIHWWTSNARFLQIWEEKQLIFILDGLRVSHVKQMFILGVLCL